MTCVLLTSSRTQNKLYKKKLGKDKSHVHLIKFTQYRNIYNRLKRMTKHNYYDELLQMYQYNTRKTWGVINTLIGRTNDKTTISDTFKINNSSIDDPEQVSNEFCNYFTNIGKQYANKIPNCHIVITYKIKYKVTCLWLQLNQMKLLNTLIH